MICLSAIQTLPVPPTRSPNPSIDRFRSQFRFEIRKLKSKSDGVPALAVSEFDNFLSVSMAAKDASSSSSSVMLTSGASGRVTALFSPRVLRSFLLLVNAFLLLLLMPFRGRKDASSSSSSDKLKDEKKQKKQDSAGSSSISQSQRKGAVVRVPASVPWKSSAAAAAAVDQEVASRRALAIQRVMEDGVQGKGDVFFRDFSLFATPGGKTMFTQSWTPVSAEVRGVVVVLHGLNEHGDRYSAFAKELNVNGYKVYAMDWIGHGGSDGLHAYVHSLDEAVTDTKSFIAKVLAENPGLPCFCFGHSTGAAIILKSVLDPKIEACVAGIILTSPAVGVQPSHPIFAVLAPVFSFLFPRYQFSAANKQGMPVCRDPDALMAKYSDPLVYTGSIRVRTGYEILRITSYLQQNLTRVRVPFLVLHGAADTITDPEASKKLYEEASSTDKTIKLFDELLHDLLFEPEREAIVKGIIDWLNRRI